MALVLLHHKKNKPKINPHRKMRCRLYGRRTTVTELVNEIIRLRNNGTIQRRIPMTWNEISDATGMCRGTLYHYRGIAIEQGMMEIDEYGREIIPDHTKQLQDYRFLEKNEFVDELLIKEWIDDLRSRKNGMPIKSWKNMLSCVRFLCNNCKVKPEQLIIGRKTTENCKEFCRDVQDKRNYDKT